VAVVSGASKGIGAAIAKQLAKDGASVVVNYATSAKEAEAVVATIKAAGGKAKAVRADVSKPAESRQLVDATVSEFGRIDILVNNAGSIINIGSVASLLAPAGGSAYSASKDAVDVLTRSLATELGPKKILVNAVLPGPVETEGARSLAEFDQMLAQLLPRTPLGRVGQPHDIATVISFLASEDAGWITGQVIPVAGGLR